MMCNKFIFVAFCACALIAQAFARPAASGIKTVKNRDGSSVSIRSFGDEHYHYAETVDGFLVMGDGDGSYVYVDENGTATQVVARDAADRTAEEISFLNGLNQEAVHQKHKELNEGRFPETEDDESEGLTHAPLMAPALAKTNAARRPTPEKWTIGERYFPVLLIGTTDKAKGDSAEFYDFLNKPGYSVNNNIGSLRDYFLFVSDSLFDPHFDVYPIDINASLTSFGSGDNFKEGQFIARGIDELVKRSDFLANANRYCYSGKNVDGFIFLFPGMEEDALKQSDLFWGHQFWMESNGSSTGWFASAYKAGGYSFNKYLFIAQYADESRNSKINKMGIFAHEFSHVLGLQDHYGRDANGRQVNGPGEFDVMSLGMYNGSSTNAGDVPIGYSAFEKEWLGWLKLNEIEKDTVYSLKKLSKMQAYSVTNPNRNDEYYVVEYRPAEKYDSYVPSSSWGVKRTNGVYVWYIDYDKTAFVTNNNANGDRSHQRLSINAILGKSEYYVDFTFVNRNGVAAIPGIYNVVFENEERACFTTGQNMTLSECPEEVSSSSVESSSSVASSSSEISSSSAMSSSSVRSSSSWYRWFSSSSETMTVENSAFAKGVRMSFAGRQLQVFASIEGVKKVSLFDMQGHLLLTETFAGTSKAVDLTGIPRGVYVVRIDDAARILKNGTITVK